MKRDAPWLRRYWHRVLIHGLAWAPIAWVLIQYATDTLPFNLNRYLITRSGAIGFGLVVAALACSPINSLFGWARAIQLRRPLGVYGFVYLFGHLLAYVWLDNAFDWELIWRDILERRAMSIGLVALMMLAPLALTSTNGWQRRLGRQWKQLHRLVYLAVPLGLLHYFWLERDEILIPIIYTLVISTLLLVRLRPIRQALLRLTLRHR
jgi:methionine sulfoxide reductase heme-binding subunit